MKPTLIAVVLAFLAGCAQLPESIRHPFAARGGTVAPDSEVTKQPAYPYNSPYGI